MLSICIDNMTAQVRANVYHVFQSFVAEQNTNCNVHLRLQNIIYLVRYIQILLGVKRAHINNTNITNNSLYNNIAKMWRYPAKWVRDIGPSPGHYHKW